MGLWAWGRPALKVLEAYLDWTGWDVFLNKSVKSSAPQWGDSPGGQMSSVEGLDGRMAMAARASAEVDEKRKRLRLVQAKFPRLVRCLRALCAACSARE